MDKQWENCLIATKRMIEMAKKHKPKRKIRLTKRQRKELKIKEDLMLVNELMGLTTKDTP